jgi:hypothetical protein
MACTSWGLNNSLRSTAPCASVQALHPSCTVAAVVANSKSRGFRPIVSLIALLKTSITSPVSLRHSMSFSGAGILLSRTMLVGRVQRISTLRPWFPAATAPSSRMAPFQYASHDGTPHQAQFRAYSCSRNSSLVRLATSGSIFSENAAPLVSLQLSQYSSDT